jgi:glucose/arabinose dehydrogenase
MKLHSLQFAAVLALAACGTSTPTNAQDSGGASAPANLPASSPPFTTVTVATFDSPWAMDFLPGSSVALVTEKPGRLWLVDVATGAKQQVSGVPRVVVSSQGGFLDVRVSPRFAQDRLVYLTY